MKWPTGPENRFQHTPDFRCPVVDKPHVKEANNGQRRSPQQARQDLERNVREKAGKEKAKSR